MSTANKRLQRTALRELPLKHNHVRWAHRVMGPSRCLLARVFGVDQHVCIQDFESWGSINEHDRDIENPRCPQIFESSAAFERRSPSRKKRRSPSRDDPESNETIEGAERVEQSQLGACCRRSGIG